MRTRRHMQRVTTATAIIILGAGTANAQSSPWTCPAFTDGWFLGLMLSDVVCLSRAERGGGTGPSFGWRVSRRPNEGGQAKRGSATGPAHQVRLRPHDGASRSWPANDSRAPSAAGGCCRNPR